MLRRIMSVWHRSLACTILRRPLVCASRTLGQFPLVLEQVMEEVVAPLGRRCGPDYFQTAADGIATKALTQLVFPPEALQFNVRTLRFGAYVLSGNAGAMGFAECMTAGNKCDGFFIIHSHPAEGFANVSRSRNWIRLSVRPFRIHVDQTHLHSGKRVIEIAVSFIAFISKPRAFGAPEYVLFRLPRILASATETEGFEPHGFKRDVACENHQIGPGNQIGRAH